MNIGKRIGRKIRKRGLGRKRRRRGMWEDEDRREEEIDQKNINILIEYK